LKKFPIPVEWLIIVHPTASKVSTNVLHDWSWCDPVDNHDYSLVLSMLFVRINFLTGRKINKAVALKKFPNDTVASLYAGPALVVTIIQTKKHPAVLIQLTHIQRDS
jgi:hypothetical protein